VWLIDDTNNISIYIFIDRESTGRGPGTKCRGKSRITYQPFEKEESRAIPSATPQFFDSQISNPKDRTAKEGDFKAILTFLVWNPFTLGTITRANR
jgi:hypothetical protein